MDGWMDGWMGGWVGGSKSRVKDCLQQSKISEYFQLGVKYQSGDNPIKIFTP